MKDKISLSSAQLSNIYIAQKEQLSRKQHTNSHGSRHKESSLSADESFVQYETVSQSQKNDFYCVICRRQVRGLFSVCFKCGHGGHPHHMHEWFSSTEGQNGNCPLCGNDCICSQ